MTDDENGIAVELSGKELGEHPGTKELRKAARAYAEKYLIGKSFVNENSGHEIRVTRRGIKHALADANRPEIKLLPGLPEILMKAGHNEKAAPKPGKEYLTAVHKYSTTAKVDGVIFNVGVVTYERKNGHEHYDHFIFSDRK